MPTTLPIPEVEERTRTKERVSPQYHVIIFDDDEHTYPYVIEMMMVLFGMTPEEGFQVAYEVDHVGQAVVKTCPYDEAVESHRKIINYGPDPRMPNSKGSMGCTIERAE
ncbi:ATP-dependent Clp protease adaptor ClpS [Candidatus Poribacteria bacterium]|nr:ATP-dependent Clp protease adaptor ClpS [Candidatus Poribacteria bacterium]